MGPIAALILTYDSPENVVQCVRSIADQSLAVSEILVVENPGGNPADHDQLVGAARCPVHLLTLAENVGPAGGYSEGLRALASSACDLIWIMDDDVAPMPDCLERLSLRSGEAAGNLVVSPETIDAVSGDSSSTWGWNGVLLPRRLISEIGLPNAELFYGFEDQDFLIDRAQLAGYPLVRESSAVAKLARRDGLHRPPSHYYYLPRNATYQYLYRRRHIPFVQRVKRLTYFNVQFARSLFREPDRRWQRVRYYVRGITDGLLARLGRRVIPEMSDRPVLRHPT